MEVVFFISNRWNGILKTLINVFLVCSHVRLSYAIMISTNYSEMHEKLDNEMT